MFKLGVMSPRHIAAGSLYIAVGAFALYLARAYPFGTSRAMGAGYFPTLLSILLVGVGVVSLIKGVTVDGEEVGKIAWRPLAAITLSVLLFGILLEPIGLALSLVIVLHIAAFASPEFKPSLKASFGSVAISAACCIVFVTLLDVPMPIFGSWLQP